MESMQHGAVVVIPTYDERENIERAIDQVLAASAADVLVVDDSSPDGTGEIVIQHPAYGVRVHLLVRPAKSGLGAAYRSGFRWALNAGYSRIVQMDADLSHPPAKVADLLLALDDADLAIGSRYVSGGAIRNWTLLRRLISWAGNAYVRLVLGLPVRDATAGFKAFRAEALTEIGATSSHSNDYCFQIETTWQAVRRGMTVREVPITFTDRTLGQSKMSSLIVLEAVLRVLRWRVAELRGVPVPAARVAA